MARFAALAGLLLGTPLLSAQQPPPPPTPAAQPGDQVQELTRGPIHEAFGQPVTATPAPGPVAPTKPPEPVEEVPPEFRPAGENVSWVPGYWHYDEEAKQFVWVSGFWRDLPPGRAWVPGYWVASGTGSVWVHGYWNDANDRQIDYLPTPPETLENGPPSDPPAANQVWVPGSWLWQTNRYAWRPGFWAVGNPDWVWIPAHYEWSPLGYVFVEGYWDYPLDRRGTLFAPVTFTAYRPGIVYTPRLVVNVASIVTSLFVRPRYHHYFFGDYYAANYMQSGYYPWFAAHGTRYGYDPLYSHTRFVNTAVRREANWEDRVREVYFERQQTPAARPVRTYAELARVAPAQRSVVVQPLADVVRQRNTVVNNTTVNNFVRVEDARAREWKQVAKEYRQFADQRQQWEREKAREVRRDDRPPQQTAPQQQVVRLQLPKQSPVAAPQAKVRAQAPDRDPNRTPPQARPQIPDRLQVPQPDPRQTPPAQTQPDPRRPVPPQADPRRLPTPEDVLRPDYNRNKPAPPPGQTKPPPAQKPPAQGNPPKGGQPDKGKGQPDKGKGQPDKGKGQPDKKKDKD